MRKALKADVIDSDQKDRRCGGRQVTQWESELQDLEAHGKDF